MASPYQMVIENDAVLRRQAQGLHLPLYTRKQRTERSGPQMWARVQILLLIIVLFLIMW